MANPIGDFPRELGVEYTPALLLADATNTNKNSVPPLTKTIEVQGVVTDANDWITLPPLSSCPDGHEMVLLCNAGSNFEMRTPASSNEKINNVDSDGSQEYLCTDTQVVKIVKMSNAAGWMAHGFSRLGAVVTAVIPD